ncbi:SMI1/KNR4 family protein [Sphingorhabdus contaminans]|uniref:SMI1/KNR4 family protein n=1 Tax=Sphingorhabdus contaminans TaxID=1343899 RepID=UPI003D26E5BE
MSLSIIASLASIRGVRLGLGADVESIDKLERETGIPLPFDHRKVLQESNGAQAYGGYLTLFGVGLSGPMDLETWNDFEYWKFAWDARCCDYFCFAETGWGDQYAYNARALQSGDCAIYLLDCLSMTPTLVASNFLEFMEREFIRIAIDPYDTMIKEVRESLGDLEIGEHVVYVASPLLGGQEKMSNVKKLKARSAMIINGDIARQLDAGPSDRSVSGLTAYEDSQGRMRLTLTWT